ncbi:membrane protein [Lampropedia cohaerens]|uniref:Membrane protein n=1 Tax=Lampropedia cohaerens TaxID=1610491 RepID=A0A0U1PYB4_9BURK|nr:membrane protein [Lampropedia cohaerens]
MAVGLLSACAPLPRPLPQDAEVSLPARWTRTAQEASRSQPPSAAIETGWWRQLGDTELDALVAQALAHNSDLGAAMARVEQARANFASAEAAAWPSLNASAGVQAGRNAGAAGMALTRSTQAGLQASWEPDLWQRITQQSQAAAQRLQASQADRDAVALAVTASTVRGYIDLRALQAQREIAVRTVQSRRQSLALAQEQRRVGYISQWQLTQAEAELEGVQQQVAQLDGAIQQQLSALGVLLGQPGLQLPPAGGGEGLQALQLLPVPDSLPSQLLERRADIASARHLLLAADHSLEAQRAAFLPQVQLSASAGSLLVNSLDYNPATLWSLGGSLLAPLFDAGRRQAQFDAATAQRDQAAWAYRHAVLSAFADVETALTGSVQLARQMDHALRRRDVLQRSLAHAHERYLAGYASYLEELDAQRNLFQAELAVVQLYQAQLSNRVALYQALGGGWSAQP